MRYFISKSVLDGGSPGFATIEDENWVIVGHEDLNRVDSEKSTSFHEVSSSFFTESYPAFAEALEKELNAQLFVDAITGQVNVNTNHRPAGFITDMTARASNQANLKASWWAIIKGRPGYLRRTTLLIAGTLVLCVFISWLFLFYLARILASQVLIMQAVHNGLLSGDLNPGIVINESPLRIAIMTDLSLGSGSYPVLRVIDTTVPARYRKKGSKIPCAGGYQQIDEEVNKPYWDFYDATPLVNYTDTATASMKRFEIPQYQWDSLYEACGTLPDVPNIGFYTLQDRENDWPVDEDFRFYDQKARMYGDKGEQLGNLD